MTSGSRGDVQPYVLLGMELAARGHEVVLATEARMERLVEQLGAGRLTFHRIAGDPTGMLFSKESQVRRRRRAIKAVCGVAEQRQELRRRQPASALQRCHAAIPSPQALLAAGRILPVMRAVEVHNKAHYADALDDTAAACAGASLIVAAPLTLTATMCVAEKLRVPWVPVVLGPVMPTGVLQGGGTRACACDAAARRRHIMHDMRAATQASFQAGRWPTRPSASSGSTGRATSEPPLL